MTTNLRQFDLIAAVYPPALALVLGLPLILPFAQQAAELFESASIWGSVAISFALLCALHFVGRILLGVTDRVFRFSGRWLEQDIHELENQAWATDTLKHFRDRLKGAPNDAVVFWYCVDWLRQHGDIDRADTLRNESRYSSQMSAICFALGIAYGAFAPINTWWYLLASAVVFGFAKLMLIETRKQTKYYVSHVVGSVHALMPPSSSE
ncbi:MAG: hypothetical protein AAFN41_08335 [Planctomycetota bacterium]